MIYSDDYSELLKAYHILKLENEKLEAQYEELIAEHDELIALYTKALEEINKLQQERNILLARLDTCTKYMNGRGG